jgi:hypothetical protein
MRFARPQFIIGRLMGVLAVTAVLVGGVVLLLRYPATTSPPLPTRFKGGVILEGVDIYKYGLHPKPARPSARQRLFPPDLQGDLRR